ncbi:DOWNY MILDEW RESISTANCE 6 [Olea europaea subsp. europaea]|uniref:DOWNY MILDEW RESISTANCE 6 n=1 Tax=Olea europaea subsp. europaea TaxID=158383 RepID=A0A8S0QZW4_OLEEU|nr:DOWNY MILDEW RESISTANCE 6 [Olea europaea subsp. europaea]
MKKNNESSSSFPIGETAQEKRYSHAPEFYKLQPFDRPHPNTEIADIPVIDMEGMCDDPTRRIKVVQDIGNACKHSGFFQVINHGISQPILDGAISTAARFFDLPTKEKEKFMSNEVHEPVRYGTSIQDGLDKVQFWRVFLKQYAHPLKEWVHLWPNNPPEYRQKMGDYAVAVQKMAIDIMGAITESLGLGPTYLTTKLDDGMQVMFVNCYPRCSQPELALGLPPHTDYTCITIVLQNSADGLEIRDLGDGSWRLIPLVRSALQVNVGDYLEVLSNGRYKSVVHRVTLNNEKARISISSLHSLGMDVKMESAKELVDEEHPKGYKESSFNDFLDFISKNNLEEEKSFLKTVKIQK